MNKDIKYLKMCIEGARLFSTCDKRKYMAMILDTHGYKVGEGYNGGPKGMPHCNDGACPRLNSNSAPGSNYGNCIAIHAEANALLHSDYTARRGGGTLYVNGPPCFDCAKLISNSGIQRVVGLHDESYKTWNEVHAFLMSAGIRVEMYEGEVIDLWR